MSKHSFRRGFDMAILRKDVQTLRSWGVQVALFFLATTASAQLVNEPTADYWPLAQGNTWVYSNTTNDPSAVTTIKIQGTPTSWGCSSQAPQPNAAINAYFDKSLPNQDGTDTYWNPGHTQNLGWMLGNDPQGNLFSWGWYVWDYTQNQNVGNAYVQSETFGFPGYLLLPPTVSENQDATLYNGSPGNNCAHNPPGTAWQITWNTANVNTPAYSGNTIQAFYNEEELQDEQWYFAKQIGPVRIYEDTLQGQPYTTPDPPFPPNLELQSYSVIGLYANAAAISPTNATYLVAPVGTAVNYEWFAKFFPTGQLNNYSSYFTVDSPDDCGLSPNNQYPWVINNPNGTSQAQIASCQGTYRGVPTGHTYTINYLGTDGSNNPHHATLTVVVPPYGTPGPSLTANGGTSISVNVGDNIDFAWLDTSGLGTSASSYYYVDQADNCGSIGYNWNNPQSSQNNWDASSLNGTLQATVAACQAGRTYTINYVVNNSNGNFQSTSTITVYVNPGSPAAQLTVTDLTNHQSCNQNNCQITANVGDTLNYSWSSSNEFWVLSYFTVDPPDHCATYQEQAGVQYPWQAYSLSGSLQGQVAQCQSGTTYTITYEVSGQDGAIVSSSVQVQVQ